ncbi:DNA-directed RNA polymerase sigma-70 factor, partial [Streptomyces sp. NPDC059564]|uniref:DNA-directed RNA polymerase sigma-70 factor n=1 Tax=Streptomyces sp. NPDC059564 TaxID=3346865 RepID=UPI00368B80C2
APGTPEPPGPPDPAEPSAPAGAAPRAATGVRAFATGGAAPARSGGPGTRPKPAAKGTARPPVSLTRHEAKTPVRTGSGGGGGSGDPDEPVGPSPAHASAPAPVLQPEPKPAAPQNDPAQSDPSPPGAPPRPGQAAQPGETAHSGETTQPGQAPQPGEAAQPGGEPPQPGGEPAQPPPSRPAQAFDALYARAAPALVRQSYLLTGRPALAQQAVEQAFRQAWGRWPEVATDPDPVGWVRATAYDYALSPWPRLRHRYRRPGKAPAEPVDRMLLNALLDLPPAHRRTVLLYDGIGLDLPDTAAETEATTLAAGNRLLHAHAALADRVPGLTDVAPGKQSAVLRELLAAVRPPVPLEPRRTAAAVRVLTENRALRWARAALGLTTVIAVATGYTTVTAPGRYEPPLPPGTSVSGVPPHSGPQRLTDRSRELQNKLRDAPAAGPARISPGLE